MNTIEILRNKLHEAIDRGNEEEILFLSEKLDEYIVLNIKESITDKK